jgi:hypothetical protein
MARCAGILQLASMFILMASQTLLRKAQERSISVLDLEGVQFLLRDKLLAVALLAGKAGVLTLQNVAGFPVIKRVASLRP